MWYNRYMKTCTIKNCARVHKAKGLCALHYNRKRLTGTTTSRYTIRGGDRKHPLYSVFYGMIQRCSNEDYWYYHRYGGRGIKVCDRWAGDYGFEYFLEDMGDRPTPKHQLDRIDNDKGYSKENCRWATKYEQMANTSNTHGVVGVNWHKQRGKWRARIKINGKEKSLGLYDNKEDAIKARHEFWKNNGLL